ncbi:hypothetical protein H8N03_24655 [Ramlibacter sp. USB13]|uniref:Transmembrane protein n=1 Tax=Ramlibacter cellulosilyticus TaxID=2764187 RepID=A0A923MWT9_9BURK|nr:hypothetical protein [Ramlibacter cellulosilyticus]MBC5786153.1 hypothetical protein [Ramlibacter cellulosilyticus]
MGFLLYGGLGLLPLWGLIAYALLAQPSAGAEPSGALLWWSLGAVPACFMTLMFAEAIMVARERRPDPWRQHRIVLIVVPMAALLYASGLTWERQESARADEEARILRFVLAHPAVGDWLGEGGQARITLSQPNPDLQGAPLRYWVTADNGLRRVQAVVAADRRVSPSPLALACHAREIAPVRREAPPLACGR